jgi:multiple sugar transport system permease protein
VWRALGLAEVSWANSPWGARVVVMIGDIWQWTPFMFIVLLAALENLPAELTEAAMVDGASRWQIFWKVSWPQLVPVSSTVILIRVIEAFKIVDLPNVLTNGGPGTATESLTLHAYMAWRTLDIGGSAAVAYTLLFVVTFVAMSYIALVHRRLAEAG